MSSSCVSGCTSVSFYTKKSEDRDIPRNAFVQIKHSVDLEGCGLDPVTKQKKCQKATMRYVSSGSFVFHSEVAENISYVLTAGHSCENKMPKKQIIDGFLIQNKGSRFKVVDLDGHSFDAQVIQINKRFDLCLMRVTDVYKRHPVLKLADKSPYRGETVINMAAPHGLFWPGAVLMFKGMFSGYHTKGYSIYTIPTKPGSSGSPIINANHKLIGVIFAGYSVMENVGLSSPLVAIRVFLKKGIALGEMQMWEKENKPETNSQIDQTWMIKMKHRIDQMFGAK